MQCRFCGHHLTPTDTICPACASPVRDNPQPRWRWQRLIPWAIVAIGIVRIALFVTIGLEFQWPFQASSIADAATKRAGDDPRTSELLGSPVTRGWSVFGYSTGDRYNSWAGRRLWIPLRGSNGNGRLSVQAENSAGTWLFTSLELHASSGVRVDLLETRTRTPPPRSKGPVYLVALEPVRTVSLESLATHFRTRFDLNVSVLPPIALDGQGFDDGRQQFAAEALSSLLRRRLPEIVQDPTASIIAVLDSDLYSRRAEWSFLFTYRAEDRIAIVATKRLVPSRLRAWNRAALLEARVRKLIARDLGVLVFDLPLNSDPTSALYQQLLSVGDLDVMQERFDGLGALAEVNPPATAHRAAAVEPVIRRGSDAATPAGRYPCLVVKPGLEWDGARPIDANITECLPGLRNERSYDEFEIDFRGGLLKTRFSDLFVPDTVPLVFTRCYRLWDNVSRAFGIGWNHPYDIWPNGSRNPYTFVDVVMPDGDAIHYERISTGTGYTDAVYEHVETTTPFLRSQIRWNGTGWDLTFQDGGSMLFPENYNGTKSHHGAPFEMRDAAGNVIRFLRDGDRNLQRLTSPSGRTITLEHDSQSRVTSAADDAGHVVRYGYDAGGRLVSTTSGGQVVQYAYNYRDLVSIDASGRSILQIQYDDNRRVSDLVLGDGQRFRFDFVTSFRDATVRRVVVQRPGGKRETVTINP